MEPWPLGSSGHLTCPGPVKSGKYDKKAMLISITQTWPNCSGDVLIRKKVVSGEVSKLEELSGEVSEEGRAEDVLHPGLGQVHYAIGVPVQCTKNTPDEWHRLLVNKFLLRDSTILVFVEIIGQVDVQWVFPSETIKV